MTRPLHFDAFWPGDSRVVHIFHSTSTDRVRQLCQARPGILLAELPRTGMVMDRCSASARPVNSGSESTADGQLYPEYAPVKKQELGANAVVCADCGESHKHGMCA